VRNRGHKTLVGRSGWVWVPAKERRAFADQSRTNRRLPGHYATLTAFTDPLFRSMADGLQGLEWAPGPS
jgi:hypothetical protein